jgi:hypothetical protein
MTEPEEKLEGLPTLDRGALIKEWTIHFGSKPPPRLSRQTLTLGIGHALQVKAHGGLSRRHAKRLDQLIAQRRSGNDLQIPTTPPTELRPGVRLMREWNGQTHTVDVVDNGFVWRDRNFTSLSAIAREITGTRWSGPRFFGLTS